MKKYLLIFFIIGITKASALPVSNPNQAILFADIPEADKESAVLGNLLNCDYLRFQIGYYGDFVFNRRLETIFGRHIDYTQIVTNAGYLALTVWDCFDIFTAIGATKFKINTSLGPFNNTNPSPRFDLETTTDFSWSLGAHATLWECKGVALGVEAQYFFCNPRPKAIFVRTNVDVYPSNTERINYTEWQIGAGLSYRLNPYFVPYLAMKCARALWEFNNITYQVTPSTTATLPNLKSGRQWGYAIGASFAPLQCQNLALTVEGRFADETALFVNATLFY